MRKKLWIRILSIMIILLALVGISFMTSGYIMGDVTQSGTIEVKDGVASPAREEGNSFTLEEEGEYVVYAKCENDTEGLITAFVLYDEDGKMAFFCTGEEFQVESSELELKPGNYKVEMRYITSQEELAELMVEGKGENYSDEEYAFAENGTFNVTMEYNVKEEGSMNIYYLLGMICGVAAGIALVALVMWLVRKMGGKIEWNCNKENAYDERQLLARGVAYKYAFFTLLLGLVIASVLDEISGISLFMSFAGIWIEICLSIAVFATICIVKDAYMSLYENVKGIVATFAVIGLSNLGIGSINVLDGEPLIENGVLTKGCTNLIVGVLFIYILLVFIGRVIYSNKQMEEDEE